MLLMGFSKMVSLETLGVLSFIASLISILALLSDLGLSDAQHRFLAQDRSLLAPILNWEWGVAVATGLAVWAAESLWHFSGGHGLLLGAVIAYLLAHIPWIGGFLALCALVTAAAIGVLKELREDIASLFQPMAQPA